jgi:soluble lytic murein transglycosylase-like protein
MNALALVLVALVSISHERAIELAHNLQEAADLAHVDVASLTALAYYESGFDAEARSSVGARGVMQLHHRWYGRMWQSECRLVPGDESACDMLNVRWGAWALRDALQACGGSYAHAFGWYRTGSKCLAGPRAKTTMRLAMTIRYRLSHPSTRPIQARLLP